MRLPNFPNIIVASLSRLKETSYLDSSGEMQDGFLFGKLREYNLHKIFAPIYDKHKDDRELAVIKTAFTILAYSYNSKWMNDKDRYINKREILSSLSLDAEIEITESDIDIILNNRDAVLMDCIDFWIHSQKDSDFITLFSLMEHISYCNSQLRRTNDATDKMLAERTKYANEIEEMESSKDKLISELQSKYMILDEALKAEGIQPITENIDMTVYENRLRFRIKQREEKKDI